MADQDAGNDNEILTLDKEILRDLDSPALAAENVKGGAGLFVKPGVPVMTGTSVILPTTAVQPGQH